jgi:predicted Holliday junction resolvase-like endonuclease
MSQQLGFIFLVLFVVAAAACVYLSITMSRRVQTAVNQWCNEERQALDTQLRDLANADARVQIERWKQQREQEIRLDAVQSVQLSLEGR